MHVARRVAAGGYQPGWCESGHRHFPPAGRPDSERTAPDPATAGEARTGRRAAGPATAQGYQGDAEHGWRGDAWLKDAPLTIVEYTDYQCPFCQRFNVTAFNDLKKNYIDTGKVRFYSRDLPLDFHPNAMRAAMAAHCAAEQGQLWKLRGVMGANPDKLDMDHIAGFAADLKMDTKTFRACVEGEKYKNVVQTDVLEAMKIGASGTPTFVIGKSTANGVEGEVMEGAMPLSMFEQKLKDAQEGK